MGFFSKLTGSVFDLNNLAIAVGNVIVLLDEYDLTREMSLLPIAGWICKKGIQDMMETGQIDPTLVIGVMVNCRLQRMSVMEACTKSVGRYQMIAAELSEQEEEEMLDILNGGEGFKDIEASLTPQDQKKLLKRNIRFY